MNVCSVLRLITLIENQAGTYPTLDPSWYGCSPIVLSALEVHLATICASLPVFWPIIKDAIAVRSITVTREVQITRETRDLGDWEFAYDMETQPTEAMMWSKRKMQHAEEGNTDEQSMSPQASVASAIPKSDAYMNMIYTRDGTVDAALSFPSRKRWIEHQLIGIDGSQAGRLELAIGKL